MTLRPAPSNFHGILSQATGGRSGGRHLFITPLESRPTSVFLHCGHGEVKSLKYIRYISNILLMLFRSLRSFLNLKFHNPHRIKHKIPFTSNNVNQDFRFSSSLWGIEKNLSLSVWGKLCDWGGLRYLYLFYSLLLSDPYCLSSFYFVFTGNWFLRYVPNIRYFLFRKKLSFREASPGPYNMVPVLLIFLACVSIRGDIHQVTQLTS